MDYPDLDGMVFKEVTGSIRMTFHSASERCFFAKVHCVRCVQRNNKKQSFLLLALVLRQEMDDGSRELLNCPVLVVLTLTTPKHYVG